MIGAGHSWRWACACVIGVLTLGVFAGGAVVERVEFQDGMVPEGWKVDGNAIMSPVYSNKVSHVELSYSAVSSDMGGRATLYAVDYATSTELEIASLNTLSSGSAFDFLPSSDFRSFRIVANGLSPQSFSATWIDTRLAPPANVFVSNNTGSAFDMSWSTVDFAIGYMVSVWTNRIIGAFAGTASWVETFADMPAGKSSALNQDRLALADHGSDWRGTSFENGFLLDNGGGIRLGTSTAAGRMVVPHVVGSGENALRVTAYRYSQDKGQALSVSCISDDGAVTNMVEGLPFAGLDVATGVIILPSNVVGLPLILETVCAPGEKDGRIAVTRIEFISGYEAGVAEREVLREETFAASVTNCSVLGLPSAAVSVGVRALAADAADNSELSSAQIVDLANPPPTPVLAVQGSVVSHGVGYVETFDALSVLPSVSVWADGLTMPYWQVRKGDSAINKITVRYGMSNQSGGLYAYHGTNRSDVASFSLAAVANTSNKIKFGMAVTNDTDGSLSNFQIGFTGRQWTFSPARTVAQSLHFSYLVTNSVLAVSDEGQWVEVESLRFDAVPLLSAASAAADYSTGSVRATRQATLEGVVLRQGEVLMLRWTPDSVPNGESLGIDNLSVRSDPPLRGVVFSIVRKGSSSGFEDDGAQ